MLEFNATVMTLVHFRSNPRQGHLDRCKRVVSHLDKLKWDAVRISTEEPDLSSTLTTLCEWEESACDEVK